MNKTLIVIFILITSKIAAAQNSDTTYFEDEKELLALNTEIKVKDNPNYKSALSNCSSKAIIENLDNLLSIEPLLKYQIPLIIPMKGKVKVQSNYGIRLHPNTGKIQYHKGLDITPCDDCNVIFATAEGFISKVGYDPDGYGYYVVVSHYFGYETIYAHLSTILSQVNSIVYAGTPIGLMGKSGNATGFHLHYEIRKNGFSVNPKTMFIGY